MLIFIMKKILLFFTLFLVMNAVIAGQKNCAIVVMHGKWGGASSLGFFSSRLTDWCDYKEIELPWSKNRLYDKPYPDAINEIHLQVNNFKVAGYKRVLLAGHSFGANAALAYLTIFDDVDGVILLAPGHTPKYMFNQKMNLSTLEQAKELINNGKGIEKVNFVDFNQGRSKSLRASAESFYSYFDPEGLGNMSRSAKSIKKSVPILMVVGTKDPQFLYAEENIYLMAPQNPYSKYMVVEADHGSTPSLSVNQVNEWIGALLK
jgi:pimeloyl-ACP methyl ester carboxylesterase